MFNDWASIVKNMLLSSIIWELIFESLSLFLTKIVACVFRLILCRKNGNREYQNRQMNARNVTVTVTQPVVFMMKRLMSGTSLWIFTETMKVAEFVRNAKIILRETTVKDVNRDFSDLMKLQKPIPANVRAIIIRWSFFIINVSFLQNIKLSKRTNACQSRTWNNNSGRASANFPKFEARTISRTMFWIYLQLFFLKVLFLSRTTTLYSVKA